MHLNLYKTFISSLLAALILFASCHSSKKVTQNNYTPTNKAISKENKPLKKRQLKRKYAAILKTTPGKIKNRKLYYFVDDWYGVKYKWGGNDQQGVDCSGFVHQLYLSVYGLNIKRTVATLHDNTKNFRKQRKLREGDLIYFKEDDDPSHVAVYLKNGFFVHSSKGKGVHINNLNENYWEKIYAGGGKVKK